MTKKVRILIGAVLFCGLIMIINMLRKRELELKYVLGWLLCDIVLLIFTAVPGLMVGFSNFLGIYSPVNMIFFSGFCVLIDYYFLFDSGIITSYSTGEEAGADCGSTRIGARKKQRSK